MTPAQFAAVLAQEFDDRLAEAIRDLHSYCKAHNEPLTEAQRFAIGSLRLRLGIGLEEPLVEMCRTYDAIRRVMPELPEWPDELVAWVQTAERKH